MTQQPNAAETENFLPLYTLHHLHEVRSEMILVTTDLSVACSQTEVTVTMCLKRWSHITAMQTECLPRHTMVICS